MALLCPAGEDVVLEALEDRADGDDASAGGPDWRADVDLSRPQQAAQRGRLPSPRWDRERLRSYFARQDSRALAAQVECPVLLVHARQDDVVPFAHSLLLALNLHTETTLLALEGGSHTTAQHDFRVHRYTVAWLLERTEGETVSACTRRT
jgi:pimeloyl-ACP methyl ester carboxylesterase